MTDTSTTQSPLESSATPNGHRRDPGTRRTAAVAVGIVVLAIVLGAAVTALLPRTYAAESKVLLRPAPEGTVPAAEAVALATAQVDTYAALATTPTVLDPAIDAAGVDTDSATLAEDTSATPVPKTTIITITVSAGQAREAAELSNAVAENLLTQVGTQSTVAGQAVMTGEVVERPLVPEAPTSPRLLLNLLAAAAVGLAVAGVFVWLRLRFPRRSGV
ncbi:YveK family protein [Kineococcus sp. TBRC 1896]|uniref:YveK family protein n=1 Tax=Kineococcus mangrovi TaxID=1660183 RepID=A0ABV4I0T3_9ACTN